MKRKPIEIAIFITAVLLVGTIWCSKASAIPSSYVLSGVGYGDLNSDPGTTFDGVKFTLTLSTTGTTTVDSSTGQTYVFNLAGSATIGSDAFGFPGYSGLITDNLYLTYYQPTQTIEWGTYDPTATGLINQINPLQSISNIGIPGFDILSAMDITRLIDSTKGFMNFADMAFNMNTFLGDPNLKVPDVLTIGVDPSSGDYMDYTAVPEPSTFVLLGAGLLACATVRRLRKTA